MYNDDKYTTEQIRKESPDSLGDLICKSRPSKLTIVAGSIFVLLAFGAGCCMLGFIIMEIVKTGGNLPLWDPKKLGWMWAVFFIGVIGFLWFIAGAFLYLVIGLTRVRFFVYSNGFFIHTDSDEMLAFSWDDIVEVRETVFYEKPPILHFPFILLLPTFKSSCYDFIRRDGVSVRLNRDMVPKLESHMKSFRNEMSARFVPWMIITDKDYSFL